MSQGQRPPTAAEFVNATAMNHDRDFAEVPDNLWSNIARSPGFQAEFNEENVFQSMYLEAAQQYYAQATSVNAQGRTLLNLFGRWQDVVSNFVQFVLRGDADNPLDAVLDWDPEGAGEAMIRPFREDTWNTNGASYRHTPTSTGEFDLIPDTGSADVETATENEQAWIIFGWYDNAAGSIVPYDYLQADVNDNVGVRREEFLKYQMEGQDTLGWSERLRGPLMVPPGFDLDIDINVAETGIETALWPVGIEVIRADATEFGGVADS